MYSLEINFLNDRPDYKPPEPSKASGAAPGANVAAARLPFLIGGIAVGVAAIGSVMGWWWVINSKNARLEAELTKLEGESGLLSAEVKKVNDLEAKTKQYETQTQFFASIFDTSVKPVSSLLQELSDILPPGVQISSIDQKLEQAEGDDVQSKTPWGVIKQNIEITGLSPSFAEVNDFMLMLKESSFFNENETQLTQAELVEIPIDVEWKGKGEEPEDLKPKVVQYKITTSATNVLASEMLGDLQRTNANGLLTRMARLQQLGVISNDSSK
jgi:type IV pilus assembly protein PilN